MLDHTHFYKKNHRHQKAKSQNTLMRGQAEQVERIADNLEKMLLCTFLFLWAKLLK